MTSDHWPLLDLATAPGARPLHDRLAGLQRAPANTGEAEAVPQRRGARVQHEVAVVLHDQTAGVRE
jgi:hypothetical protein